MIMATAIIYLKAMDNLVHPVPIHFSRMMMSFVSLVMTIMMLMLLMMMMNDDDGVHRPYKKSIMNQTTLPNMR